MDASKGLSIWGELAGLGRVAQLRKVRTMLNWPSFLRCEEKFIRLPSTEKNEQFINEYEKCMNSKGIINE